MDITCTSVAPIVFTKDRDFQFPINVKPGQIVYLPEDAVLYFPPEVVGVEMEPVDIVGITPASLREKKKDLDDAIDEHNQRKQPKLRKCSACGEPGHIARKCPKNGTSDVEEKKADCLSEEEYDSVIELFKMEQSTKPVADALGFPLSEVNRACKTGRYSQYVKRWERDEI